jgi:RNA polymerase sigma-70 factor (ECF subfamily)
MNERPVPAGEFADEVLPHLDAAYNLARWIVRNADDAEDIVQDACLRAFRYFKGFRGGDARAWLLAIVRNTAYQWLSKHRSHPWSTEFDEAVHAVPNLEDPEALLRQDADSELVERAIQSLPPRLREVLVLRELEGLSYKEIAAVVNVPIGTVMSSLSRARERFRQVVIAEFARMDAVGAGRR